MFLYTFRHVQLPKDLAKLVPKSHLMTEAEWRGLGVQQSQGWIHYMIHQPGNDKMSVIWCWLLNWHFFFLAEPHILLFRRPITTPPPTEEKESWKLSGSHSWTCLSRATKCDYKTMLPLIIIPFDVSSSISFFPPKNRIIIPVLQAWKLQQFSLLVTLKKCPHFFSPLIFFKAFKSRFLSLVSVLIDQTKKNLYNISCVCVVIKQNKPCFAANAERHIVDLFVDFRHHLSALMEHLTS